MDSMSCKEELQDPMPLKSLAFDVKDSNGNNLLHRFVMNNCTTEKNENYINAVLRSLLGVKVNDRNSEGYTALHLAVREGSFLMVRKLLACVPTIEVNSKSLGGGETALHLAAALRSGGEDVDAMIKYLIINGADPNAEDYYGNSPLHVSVENNNLKAVKGLLGCQVYLHRSNEFGFKICIAVGANVDIRDKIGKTPLHVAVEGSYLEVVKALIDCNADLNLWDVLGDTPLHVAVRRGFMEIVNVLIEAGADLDICNEDGDTPLHAATKQGCIETIRALIEAGADLDICNEDGDTPLHAATKQGCIETVRAIVEAGADVDFPDEDGDTPLHTAAKGIVLELVKEENYLEIVKILLESGSDLDCRNVQGDTPLHKALYQSNFKVAKFLLESGAALDCRNEKGDTPLGIIRLLEKSNGVLSESDNSDEIPPLPRKRARLA